jgi:hypothetical protein
MTCYANLFKTHPPVELRQTANHRVCMTTRLDSAGSIKSYLMEPLEKVYLNRPKVRMGMQNVYVVKRRREGAAGTKGDRSRLLHEKE